jgi:predicted dehydrogenase
MPHPLRVLLLGYGLAGRVFHAPLVTAADDLALVGVVTRDPGRAAAAAADLPGVAVHPDPVAALEQVEADLVVVATANAGHVPLTEAALRLGRHVVLDKPMAPDATAAAALVRAAEAAERQLHVFHNRRWDSDFLTLQALVADGALGDVHRMESRFERWRPVPSHGWRDDPDPAAMGGLLLDLGSHLVDQALQLLGPVTAVSCSARARRNAAGPDDDTVLVLEHECGAASLLWMGSLAADPAPRFRVRGSAGAWTVDGLDGQEAALAAGRRPGDPGWGVEPADRASRRWPSGEDVPLLPGRWDTYYPAVAAAVRGSAAPPVDPWSAVAVMRVLDEARAAIS